jgi:hypothetical protein
MKQEKMINAAIGMKSYRRVRKKPVSDVTSIGKDNGCVFVYYNIHIQLDN